MEWSDEQLVKDYLTGDEKSLEILIRRYLKPIYSFAYKYAGNSQDAEDITQDTFVKVWRNLKRFDLKKSFKTWIFTIAKNTCIDFFRKNKTISFSEIEDKIVENDKLLEHVTIARSWQTALESLLPKYRLVLSLRYNENLSFREIAETLGEPLNTVKSRHRRALNILRKNLV